MDVKLSRKEVARIFGLSESEIRRREANQVIRPRRNERGICYYLDTDLPQVSKAINKKLPRRYGHLLDQAIDWRHPRYGERSRPLVIEYSDALEEDISSPHRGAVYKEGVTRISERREEIKAIVDADEWRKVLASLRAGKSPIECCEEHGIRPATMRGYMAEYEDLRALGNGGLYLSQEVLDRIHKLPLEGPVPVRKGEDLVEILSRMIEEAEHREACEVCGKGVAEVCRPCLKRAAATSHPPLPSPTPPDNPQ